MVLPRRCPPSTKATLPAIARLRLSLAQSRADDGSRDIVILCAFKLRRSFGKYDPPKPSFPPNRLIAGQRMDPGGRGLDRAR